MRLPKIGLLLVPCALLAVSGLGVAAESSETFFAASGDVTVTVDEATATMTKIRDLIPAITIISAPASVQKLGSTYGANLFFSTDFDPKPGKYPIEFSYRGKANTLGASFRGDGTTFSHDTKGTAEFIEFGEQRRRVTVKGEAVCAAADIFGGLAGR
jgi:hypothetical protein